MGYVSALVPPIVMAVAFTCLVVTIIRNQGGANASKEDAVADAIARAEAADRAVAPAGPAATERPSGA